VSAPPERARLDALAAKSPEFAPWLAAVEIALAEIAAPTWAAAPAELAPDPPAGAPRLAGARLVVARGEARRFLDRLLEAAAEGAAPERRAALRALAGSDRIDVLWLLGAAVDHDAIRVERISREAGGGGAALGPLAQLAATPLLQACRRALPADPAAAWAHGYCPVCGAWPAMAELRGLDRARRLRCGRCGADWGAPALGCPFCGERDHNRLPSLLPEQQGEARKVDACDGCRGYLKTLTTLAAWPGEAVQLEDLATIDLDLAAMSRGYARPAEPGLTPGVRVEAAPERRWSLRRILGS
jgi:FdhE protein